MKLILRTEINLKTDLLVCVTLVK